MRRSGPLNIRKDDRKLPIHAMAASYAPQIPVSQHEPQGRARQHINDEAKRTRNICGDVSGYVSNINRRALGRQTDAEQYYFDHRGTGDRGGRAGEQAAVTAAITVAKNALGGGIETIARANGYWDNDLDITDNNYQGRAGDLLATPQEVAERREANERGQRNRARSVERAENPDAYTTSREARRIIEHRQIDKERREVRRQRDRDN
jgi:hypothetical protein